MKIKTFLWAKPGHEKVLALQKAVQILNKTSKILIPDKLYKKSPNFMKFELTTINIPGGKD